MSGTFAPVSVKVKNIAFSKDVAIHYTPDGSVWKDVSLSFSSHYGDYDVFGGTVNEQVSEFVIRYTVAGSTYYDNNAGLNYRFTSNLTVVGGNVILYSAKARRGMEAGGGFTFITSWLEGEILVNNLAYSVRTTRSARWTGRQSVRPHFVDGLLQSASQPTRAAIQPQRNLSL